MTSISGTLHRGSPTLLASDQVRDLRRGDEFVSSGHRCDVTRVVGRLESANCFSDHRHNRVYATIPPQNPASRESSCFFARMHSCSVDKADEFRHYKECRPESRRWATRTKSSSREAQTADWRNSFRCEAAFRWNRLHFYPLSSKSGWHRRQIQLKASPNNNSVAILATE